MCNATSELRIAYFAVAYQNIYNTHNNNNTNHTILKYINNCGWNKDRWTFSTQTKSSHKNRRATRRIAMLKCYTQWWLLILMWYRVRAILLVCTKNERLYKSKIHGALIMLIIKIHILCGRVWDFGPMPCRLWWYWMCQPLCVRELPCIAVYCVMKQAPEWTQKKTVRSISIEDLECRLSECFIL